MGCFGGAVETREMERQLKDNEKMLGALSSELESLRGTDIGRMADELKRLAADRDAMFGERMKMKEEITDLKRERDEIEKERDRLARENNHLAEDVAFAKKRALHIHETELELKKVRDERSALSKELCDMNIKYNNTLKELVTLKQDISTVKLQHQDAVNTLLVKDTEMNVLKNELRDVSMQQYDAELDLKNHLCICEERIAELARINESLEEKIERLKEEKSRILVYMYEKYHGGADATACNTYSQTGSIRSTGNFDAKNMTFKTVCGGRGSPCYQSRSGTNMETDKQMLSGGKCMPCYSGSGTNDSAKMMSMEFQRYRQSKLLEMMKELGRYDEGFSVDTRGECPESCFSEGSQPTNVDVEVSVSVDSNKTSCGCGRSNDTCCHRINASRNNSLCRKHPPLRSLIAENSEAESEPDDATMSCNSSEVAALDYLQATISDDDSEL